MEDIENIQDSTAQKTNSHLETIAESPLTGENKAFPYEINDYLGKISSDVCRSTNPKLKKEHQRLSDLLGSYNRLTDRLQKEIAQSNNNNKPSPIQTASSSKDIVSVLPEIYAVLRPDLYKDFREEEKKRLITKFAKKRIYTHAEKVLPPHTVPRSYVLQDRRQNEKDRFCRLVSSAHSAFLNPVGNICTPPSRYLKSLKTATFKVENVREKEKDRLAKIFATSSFIDPKCHHKSNQPQNVNEHSQFQDHVEDTSVKLQGAEHAKEAMCKVELDFNQENINPQTESNSINMVRVGEYSPLNGHHRGKTTLGVGEHDEQEKHLNEERRKDYKSLLAKQRHKAQSLTDNYISEEIQMISKPRMSSASTQTDSEDSSTSYQDNHQGDFDTPDQSITSSPQRRRPMEFSPREKLLSDLYGSPPINHYQAALNAKEKQTAYAEALRAQIEEKKRLEQERKRREKEEEELIEKRAREQAERLRIEYLKEQNKKYDWMQQRQAQEEVLRRRLLELELESQELKKQERMKKFQKNNEDELIGGQKSFPSRKVLQKRSSSHSSHNMISSALPVENKSESFISRNTFTKSPLLEIAPLLDSDRQNILSVKGGELRKGYTEEAGALALGPGVNLLSPHYLYNDNVCLKSTENKPSSKSVIREDMSNDPLEGYLPSVGHTSQRSVSHQLPSPAERHYSDQLTHSPLVTSSLSPTFYPESGQQAIPRPSSPVIPALQTDMLLKKKSKVLDDKWKVPSSETKEFERTSATESLNKKESTPSRNILTQLGEFRRKLAKEHHLLEQRLKQNNS